MNNMFCDQTSGKRSRIFEHVHELFGGHMLSLDANEVRPSNIFQQG